MKTVLDGVDAARRSAWSRGISDTIKNHPAWNRSGLVLAFLSMPVEVDTTAIIETAIAEGKSVGVPRMYGPEIRFHRITDLSGPWELHPYGLREPPLDQPVLQPGSIEESDVFVVTPGLCFDAAGRRLGFGRGYYDTFITLCRGVAGETFYFAGVCFNLQLVDRVPAGSHDCVLDAIVTERGIEYIRSLNPPSA